MRQLMSQNFDFFSTRNLLQLVAEHLTCGVELSADILADVRVFASDAFEVLPLLQ